MQTVVSLQQYPSKNSSVEKYQFAGGLARFSPLTTNCIYDVILGYLISLRGFG